MVDLTSGQLSEPLLPPVPETSSSLCGTSAVVAVSHEAAISAPANGTVDWSSSPCDFDEMGVSSPPPPRSLSSASSSSGSSVGDAIFNFTNSIIGAGAIGLGGALAQSGGLISIVTILFFAVLTKSSLDLVVQLSLTEQHAAAEQQAAAARRRRQDVTNNNSSNNNSNNNMAVTASFVSYEDLGRLAFGIPGQLSVLVCKFLYSFGCLVAYVIVVKDNLGPAVLSLVFGDARDPRHPHDHHPAADHPLWDAAPSGHSSPLANLLFNFLSDDTLVTWLISLLVILPLCLLRDMTPLAATSIVGIVAMLFIVAIVIYLFVVNPGNDIREDGGSTYDRWFHINPQGYLECLGTFVFTFVSQHTAHMTFQSLRPELRTLQNWKKVTTCSIGLSSMVSLAVGVFVYMTFWGSTQSDIFQIYPHIPLIDLAKLLLCIAMLVTFPLPFFTCRELLIVLWTTTWSATDPEEEEREEEEEDSEHEICETLNQLELEESSDIHDLEAPLLQQLEEASRASYTRPAPCCTRFLLAGQGNEKQLQLPFHVMLTLILWCLATLLAITAPSLGDVLDLVGCATGTIIAFIFPACFALKLRRPPLQGIQNEQNGHRRSSVKCQTCIAYLLLVVGGIVGLVGTIFSLRKLLADLRERVSC